MAVAVERKFKNPADLLRYIEELKIKREKKLQKTSIYVCVGTGCTASGSRKVYAKFVEVINQKGLDVNIEKIDDDDTPVKKQDAVDYVHLAHL